MNENPKPINVHNFTIAYNGRVNVLVTDIKVSLPVLPNINPASLPVYSSKAIWDTGASGSVITKKATESLKLLPISKMQVHGVNGSTIQNVYLVSITLPNNVTIGLVRVTECDSLNGPFDVLIGMDIIGLGDFAVSNSNNQTVMSFRIPSISKIDFTNPENNPEQLHLSREERRIIERFRNKHKHK
jgi:hypothetical protein